MTRSFQRYLTAKRTVDDRALDRRLVDALRERLTARATATDGPLCVLEVGAGVGTMLSRLVDWEVLPPGEIRYTAVDVDDETLGGLPRHLRAWADDRAASVTAGDDGGLTLTTADRRIEVESVVAEAAAYARTREGNSDLLVGAALLDIFDLDGLESLLGALAPGGVFYFPITFDGATRFLPSHPADRTIERQYHAHMDGKPGGSSCAGDEVLDSLRRSKGITLADVAGSDWVVRPVDGSYPADEAFFLRFILDTVEEAVGEMLDDPAPELADWLACRRRQVDDGELVYLTHQLDFLGEVDDQAGSSPPE